MDYDAIVCGNGRIGAAVFSELQAQGFNLASARIDPERGLLLNHQGADLQLKAAHLIICISPASASPAGPKWQWSEIFGGLVAQVAQNKLKVERLIFVSSTRVYDGYSDGFISASTPLKGSSNRAMQLITAEQQLRRVAQTSYFLRACGLYGNGYSKYAEILASVSDDKVRFGVNIELLIQRIINICSQSQSYASLNSVKLELVTDGMVYWQGKAYPLAVESEFAKKLAQQQRLLVNSHAFLPSDYQD
ncbi:hypothetical protein ACUR5C_01990 [Aliikangiella sp. IMCC44653]